MLRRAADKMALERLVIKKGAFKDISHHGSTKVIGFEDGSGSAECNVIYEIGTR